MRLLCLDPSLRAFGWAVIDTTQNDILACGCIQSKKGLVANAEADIIDLAFIAKELKSVIKSWACKKILFESAVGSKSSRANQSLSYVKGLVITAAVFSGLEYTAVTAKSVKLKLTGNADASKDEILKKVSNSLISFDNLVKDWPKFKIYAASDAAAVWLGTK